MPKTTKKCKVCGKEYEYCKTWLNTNRFRYQDVACSPECGAKYFEQIAISRGEAAKSEPEQTEAPAKVKPFSDKAMKRAKWEARSDEKDVE